MIIQRKNCETVTSPLSPVVSCEALPFNGAVSCSVKAKSTRSSYSSSWAMVRAWWDDSGWWDGPLVADDWLMTGWWFEALCKYDDHGGILYGIHMDSSSEYEIDEPNRWWLVDDYDGDSTTIMMGFDMVGPHQYVGDIYNVDVPDKSWLVDD